MFPVLRYLTTQLIPSTRKFSLLRGLTNSWGGTSSRHNSQSTLAYLLLLSSWSKGDPQSIAESARIQYLLPWPNQKRYRDTESSNFQTSYFGIHSTLTGYQKAVCWWQPWLLLRSTIAVWGHNRNSFYIKYWMKQKEIPTPPTKRLAIMNKS